jgi:hypothetical protein
VVAHLRRQLHTSAATLKRVHGERAALQAALAAQLKKERLADVCRRQVGCVSSRALHVLPTIHS